MNLLTDTDFVFVMHAAKTEESSTLAFMIVC